MNSSFFAHFRRSIFLALSLVALSATSQDFTRWVDPFIGTGSHGHTFPGPTRPGAMVQLSPDTHILGWEASSGYWYPDTTVYAFSHTHLSGTGIGDLGDVAVLPFSGKPQGVPVGIMDKSTEQARPGYYSVKLKNFGVRAELTSTARVGLHRYTYDQPNNRALMLNLAHVLQPNWGHKVTRNDLRVVSMSEVRGTYYTSGWAYDHRMNYDMRLSVPADSMILVRGDSRQLILTPIDLKDDTLPTQLYMYFPDGTAPVQVAVGLSPTSPDAAAINLAAESPRFDFDAVSKESHDIWEKELQRIAIETPDTAVKKSFYTALYHSLIAPFQYQDVDGKYLTINREIATDQRNPHFTVFSLWDTFRALNPLITIIKPGLAKAFARSLISDYESGTILPRWPLASNYTGCMPAYHSVSLLADLVTKGLAEGEDLKLWTEAGVRSSIYREDLDKKFAGTREHDLITRHPYFKEKYGFVPADSVPESVSWGVEMAYDDWCIARIAQAAGLTDIEKAYDKRGQYYRRYWDNSTGFMRPVMGDGKFRTPFNPRYSAHMKSDYTEGNAYQWSYFVPHDMPGFVKLMGGPAKLRERLDTLFNTSSRIDGAEQSGDITGLIGQYAHGNEPSHHSAYLYHWSDRPYETSVYVDSILYNFYPPTPEGIIGNEDCGQMSAWYILSALGFYQVCPGIPTYVIGRPIVDEAVINLPGGSFCLTVKNNSRANKYVQSAYLNGKRLTDLTFNHSDLRPGGTLEIVMGDKIPATSLQSGKKMATSKHKKR